MEVLCVAVNVLLYACYTTFVYCFLEVLLFSGVGNQTSRENDSHM